MCGIAGIVGSRNRDGVARALQAIQSRGPDGCSILDLDNETFGHLRLAIIDLDAAATQPFVSACGRYLIVFNGEIYNYKEIRLELGSDSEWVSNSDTEVLLKAYIKWGTEAFQKFHGMFAFGIWDKVEKSLILARDRVGVKPLYYYFDGKNLAFASRPKALLNLLPDISTSIDRQALRYYVEAGYVPAPHSIYTNIRKLPPAHYLVLHDHSIDISKYWEADSTATDHSIILSKEESLLDELDELIQQSVRWRMVSDVPIGAFLSGGIDSSIVAAMMCKFRGDSPVKTFTIGFADPQFDESEHAEAVAQYLGTEHFHQQLSPADLLQLMPDYLSHFDEPFYDYSAFPVMAVSRFAKAHVKVALSGDGGDEVFGGYHYYKIAQRIESLYLWPSIFRVLGAGLISLVPSHKARLLSEVMQSRDGVSAFAFMRGVMKSHGGVMTHRLRRETLSLANLFIRRANEFSNDISPAERAMRLDLAYTLPDDYLQKVDIGSMAFSLEAREPMLDQSIIEWGAKLPLEWKLRGKTNKYLLRQLAYRYIPREILDRPKQGFGVPMSKWLRNELRPWAEDLLCEHELMAALDLDCKRILELWNQHISGKRDNHTILWAIVVLLQFAKHSTISNNENNY